MKGLLAGESMVVEGKVVKLMPPAGFLDVHPVPILVAANGPKGFAVARELGDGVMTIFGGQPEFEWSALLAFGTVLDPGEAPDSERALLAAGPALTVVYHGMYEADPAQVDLLPGRRRVAGRARAGPGPPPAPRHPRGSPGARDRAGPPAALGRRAHRLHLDRRRRRRCAPGSTRTAAAGTTEILYQPCGPDVERELRAVHGDGDA